MRKPIITLTLAYITGLLLGHGFLYFPYSIGFLIIFSILISGLLTWLDKLTIRTYDARHSPLPCGYGRIPLLGCVVSSRSLHPPFQA